MTSPRCPTTNTCLVFSDAALAEALDHQPLFTEHNDVTALDGADDDDDDDGGGGGGTEVDKEKEEGKKNWVQSGVCMFVCIKEQ